MNPETPLSIVEGHLECIDLILIMTVNPGFGGQSFMEDVIPKIAAAHTLIQTTNHPILLQVDGGIDKNTAPKAIQAGAQALVAGTAIFKGPGSYAENIQALKS